MNVINFAIAQHYERRDMVIKKLTSLAQAGYSIDEELAKATMARYGILNDGFSEDVNAIISEVTKLCR